MAVSQISDKKKSSFFEKMHTAHWLDDIMVDSQTSDLEPSGDRWTFIIGKIYTHIYRESHWALSIMPWKWFYTQKFWVKPYAWCHGKVTRLQYTPRGFPTFRKTPRKIYALRGNPRRTLFRSFTKFRGVPRSW